MRKDFGLPNVSHFIFHVRDSLENARGNQEGSGHPGQADNESEPLYLTHISPEG
jgi:hypothetical protein